MLNRIRTVRVTLAALLTLSAVGLVTAADETEAPSARELKEAVDTLRDVYEPAYKAAENDTKAKKDLAKKLFDGAPKRKSSAMQYASYDEARRLAASGGDAKLALAALYAQTTKFRGTPPELTPDTLKMLGDAELTVSDAAGLRELASDAANSALEREDYSGAVVLGKLVVAAARKTEDPDIVAEARKFLTKAELLKSAVDTIQTNSTDAEANEALGQYWAFTRGRWDKGLKYLANASSKDLATVAARDLAEPKSAKERTAVADMWYKLAKDYKGAEHRRLIDRAWEWYSAALAVAVQDEDLKPAERIREIERAYPELFDQILRGHTGAAAGVLLTPNGKTLVSVGNDNSVRLWDAATGKSLTNLEGHTGWVGSVVITPDGTQAITAGGDNIIRVWDLKTSKEVRTMEGHAVAIRALALTADGKTLVSGASDKTCRVWDVAKGKEIKRFGGEKESIESVAVTPDGSRILAGNDIGIITVYDAKTGDVVSTFDKHDGTMVYTIITTADGRTAISAARDKDIHVWDIATGKEIRRFTGHTEHVYQIALSSDGKHLVSGSFDRTARVWDFATGKELKKLEGHTDGIQGICLTPDGRFVYTASWDKTIRKWRLPLISSGTKKTD